MSVVAMEAYCYLLGFDALKLGGLEMMVVDLKLEEANQVVWEDTFC